MSTLFQRVGGEAWFIELVDRFYDRVEQDPLLRPMYPEDLSGPRHRLAAFLAERWGGPPAYSEERGHPRLRMRHFPFPIDPGARDAWVRHMTQAVGAGGLSKGDRAGLLAYFESAATMVVNRPAP